MNTASRIEAILFWKQEPVSITALAALLGTDTQTTEAALKELNTQLEGRGIALIQHGAEVSLATAPEAHADIESMITEELSKELGKASMETLAIILYSGGMTRGEIEYVRGVNCSHALRHLQIRGLIERYTDRSDERKIRYRITGDTLRHLGVRTIEEIPGYADAQAKVTAAALSDSDSSGDGTV